MPPAPASPRRSNLSRISASIDSSTPWRVYHRAMRVRGPWIVLLASLAGCSDGSAESGANGADADAASDTRGAETESDGRGAETGADVGSMSRVEPTPFGRRRS